MADNFLFREVNEKEKESIRQEAKGIMDSFSKKLSKLDVKMDEPLIERAEGERKEGGKCEEIDRDIMFENASEKNDDFIVGERKEW